MPWNQIGSFFVNSNDWVFGSANLDIDSSLSIRLEYETTVASLDVYGLIADVYFDTTLSFSKPLIAQVRKFYPKPRGSDLILFSPPGRFQDESEGVDLPGGFLWYYDSQANQYVLRNDVWRRIGFKRTFKKKGVRKKIARDNQGFFQGEVYPWYYGNQNVDFRVFAEVFS